MREETGLRFLFFFFFFSLSGDELGVGKEDQEFWT